MNCDNWEEPKEFLRRVTGPDVDDLLWCQEHRYLVQTSVRERFVPS